MALFLALSSALFGGAADFAGGTASRRSSALETVGLSQFAATLFCFVAIVVTGGAQFSDTDAVLWGIPAGFSILVALVFLYWALAIGTMGIVAPIAAMGVLMPVAWDLTSGSVPPKIQLLGICLALIGIVAASGAEFSRPQGRKPIVLAIISAIGLGFGQILISKASTTDPLYAVFIIKLTVVLSLSAFVVGGVRHRHNLISVPLVTFIGVSDLAATATFAYATRIGPLSIVAILASLYPVTTVVLARWLHGERLAREQMFGVICAFGGICLIGLG